MTTFQLVAGDSWDLHVTHAEKWNLFTIFPTSKGISVDEVVAGTFQYDALPSL